MFTKFASVKCGICGKTRNGNDHRACSKIVQQQSAEKRAAEKKAKVQ